MIGNEGDQEYSILVDTIFEQDVVAHYFCTKLYRFFVHYYINDTIDSNIIQPLAKILRDNNYEIKPVLEALFSSEHFFDNKIMGGVIKTPIDFTLSPFRALPFKMTTTVDTALAPYEIYKTFLNQTRNQGQEIGNPPSVAGWEAYYVEPQYHRLWIHGPSLIQRQTGSNATFRYIRRNGGQEDEIILEMDVTTFLEQLTNKEPGVELIREMALLLLPLPLSETTLSAMATALDEYLNLNRQPTLEEGILETLKQLALLPEYQLQ